VSVTLIRHNITIILDEDKLKELRSVFLTLPNDGRIIVNTWLLDDATVLMTTWTRGEEYRTLEITISEGTRGENSMEPLCILSNTSLSSVRRLSMTCLDSALGGDIS
jgi:hypothetical protein